AGPKPPRHTSTLLLILAASQFLLRVPVSAPSQFLLSRNRRPDAHFSWPREVLPRTSLNGARAGLSPAGGARLRATRTGLRTGRDGGPFRTAGRTPRSAPVSWSDPTGRHTPRWLSPGPRCHARPARQCDTSPNNSSRRAAP